MNQPKVSCATFVNDLVQISKNAAPTRPPPSDIDPYQTSDGIVMGDGSDSSAPHYQPWNPSSDHGHRSEQGYWKEMWAGEDPDQPNEPAPENLSPAAEIFGSGLSFMDIFNTDQHAAKRIQNLYYPFSSRQDWEVASFLLRSTLSMAAIDEFLSLEMVRAYIIHLLPGSRYTLYS